VTNDDKKKEEEKHLREVALQNAQGILRERQRIEAELLKAKEELEQKSRDLARSLARLRSIFEATTDGIMATDSAGNISEFNDKFRAMWRLTPELNPPSHHHQVLDFNSQFFEDPATFIGRVDEIYASSPPESYDLLELVDGRVFERFSRVKVVDDRHVGRVWTFRDITEHKRIENALKKQSEWLRITLSSIGDGVITTDAGGRVTFLNPVAESLTGWTTEEARGVLLEQVFQIINEETRESVESPSARALREDCVVGLANHTILIAKDGTETPIDDSAAPIRDEKDHVYGVVLVFRSIVERKESEETLRRSEQQLSDFFENASVGLRLVSAEGVILRANRADLELLGYPEDEYVGRSIADFFVDRGLIDDVFRRLYAGETLRDLEAQMRCKDGSIKHVLIDSSGLWEDGRFVHTRCFTRDVTDQKRAEEVQARLAAIVESSEDAIVGKTIEGRIEAWNAGAERLFGYRPDEAIGQLITLIVPPELEDEEYENLERIRRGERIEHFETVRVTKSGNRIDVSLTISPIRDGTGRVIGASKIARDITVKRQVEFALRRKEAQFRQLADGLPQIVWTARPDGFVDYYNERWYEYSGFSRDAFGDQSWTPILHPDDLQGCLNAFYGSIATGDVYQIEYRFKDFRSGGYRWFLGRAYPVRDEQDRIIRWLGTCTDINDTKTAEERARFLADAGAALAELTDYRSTLQRVAGLAVPYFADWSAVYMRASDGTVRRLGSAHDDPSKLALIQELERRYPARLSDPHGVMKVMRTGESEWAPTIPDQLLEELAQDEEHLRLMRQLELRSFICTPLRSQASTVGVLVFATMAESGRRYDASDLVAAEDLAHRASLAIENARLLVELRKADRRKDEFLAILSHELRNPLAPIRNAVHILRALGQTEPDLHWGTQVIDRQVHQMTRLVDDLLDVSRITRDTIALRKEGVELKTVLNSAIEASQPLIEKWGHELMVNIPEEPIQLDADPARMAQVLSNLLNNAAKYMDEGGKIWVDAEREGDHVSIRVKDAGIGIPAGKLVSIFDMFTQVDRSLERSVGGLGIGLTLVKRLVEMHGGTVVARSDGPGKGSEFIVRLPIGVGAIDDGDGHGPSPGATVAVPAVPAGLRILVVDDSQDAADSLGMLLRMRGNEVQTAHDGLEAVEAAAAFQPDVVVLDIGLPVLNGYEAARRIRTQPGGGSIVLIALTGWGQEEDRNLSQEAGFDHHMTKPVDFGALQRILKEMRVGARGDLRVESGAALDEPPGGEAGL
jgi:PAS domain S-box-containing protein